MDELKWVVDTTHRDSEGFKFERLICANFDDAMEHALDTPNGWSKPYVHKILWSLKDYR